MSDSRGRQRAGVRPPVDTGSKPTRCRRGNRIAHVCWRTKAGSRPQSIRSSNCTWSPTPTERPGATRGHRGIEIDTEQLCRARVQLADPFPIVGLDGGAELGVHGKREYGAAVQSVSHIAGSTSAGLPISTEQSKVPQFTPGGTPVSWVASICDLTLMSE